jgi:hypothetical protein
MTRSARRTGITRSGITLAALAAAVLWSPAGLRADSVFVKSGDSPAQETARVQVTGVAGGKVSYRSPTGEELEKELRSVWKLKIDAVQPLNTAEDSFVAGKWAEAASGYEKAFAAAPKDKLWVKDWSAQRMAEAAKQVPSFRTQAVAYALLASRDPAAAAPFKPAIPADAKADIAAVLPVLSTLQATETIKAFQAQLFVASGQLQAAQNVVAGARSPELLVVSAQIQLKQNNHAGAMQVIQQNRAAFVSAESQVEALYVLAECQAATAGADPAKQQDAAIAYVRVVAHAGNRRTPMTEECLRKAAALLEQSGQKAEALALYQQVVEEYKGSPTTRPAADRAAELAKQVKPTR